MKFRCSLIYILFEYSTLICFFAISKKCTKAELSQVDTLFQTQFASQEFFFVKNLDFEKIKKCIFEKPTDRKT